MRAWLLVPALLAGSAADRTNTVAYVVETRTVTTTARLAVPLAPGGGLAVRFTPD